MFPDLSRRFFSFDHPEQMDLPDLDPHDLDRDLHNLEKINRFFGGHSATRFILGKIKQSGLRVKKVLDCASGAGDLTKLLSLGFPDASITAIDLHPQTLAYARNKNGMPSIDWQQADIKSLPFPDCSYDLVTCQLALHHFSDNDAVIILRELRRVSRGPVFINDLSRSASAYAGVWLLVHTWLTHPMTQHDALLSVRRAFSGPELCRLAERAGWINFKYSRLPWHRQALWQEEAR